MRIRTVLTAAVVAALAAFPLTGVAMAQPQPTDRDCRDFASQAAAQSALRSHSGDPARLDPNNNGVACEDYFTMAVPSPAPVPTPAPDVDAPQPVVDRDPSPRVVVPPPDAPDSAPVKTVPEHQILVKPHGAADTGDGSAAPLDATEGVLLTGLLGAAAALVAGRSLTRRTR
jgi:Excalibur calcium-binding domain